MMTQRTARRYFVPVLAFCLSALAGKSQLSLTSLGTPLTESFDGMGTAAAAPLPAGFRVNGNNTAVNWATGVSATTLAAGTTGTGVLTSSSSGNVYNFANGVTASATDRSLGFLNSGSYLSPGSILLRLTNNTGSTIGALTVSFDYEKYRSGTRAWNWTFFHGSTATPATAATAGDQAFPADAANTTVYNPPLSTTKTVTLTGLNIPSGSDYYLRWTLTGVGGSTNGQALGIDNVTITAGGFVSSDANLSALSISPGSLTPAFSAGTTTYTASVDYATTSVTVSPVASDAAATIQVAGTPVASGGSLSVALSPGSNAINTVVMAQSGDTKTYTVTVERAAAAAPKLTVASALPSFGNVCTGTTLTKSFTLSGSELDGSPVSLAALPGFGYAENAAGPFASTLPLSYTGSGFSGRAVYVQFAPTAVQTYSSDIVVSGGGASAITVAAQGSGVNTPPSVTTGGAAAVGSTAATLTGLIGTGGCSDVSAYGIEYSTASGFSSGTRVGGGNLANGTFTVSLSSLGFNTKYYYKAFVTTADGTTYGAQQSFATTAVPVPMASQEDLAYTEDFAAVGTWSNGFSSGTGAEHFGGLPAGGSGAIPTATRITAQSETFASGTSGGVQKGTGNIVLLSTGGTDLTTSTAFDLFLDFTGVNAGTLRFDWASVANATGDRNGSLLVYATTDGLTFTQIASVLNVTNNVATNGTVDVALPASFNGSATARLRFYYYNGTGGITPTGSRPKISVDNLVVTAVSTIPCATPAAQPTGLSFGTPAETTLTGSFTAASPAANKYLVVISRNAALTSNPTDGQTYAVGDDLGDGIVVANGSATAFTATALSGGTTYYVFVYAQNNACAGGPRYLTVDPLTGSATTAAGIPPCAAPVGQPTAFAVSQTTTGTVSGAFTASTADEFLVLRSTSPALTALPVNGTSYNTGGTLGNSVVVQRNNVTAFTAEGLAPATTYYFFVFAVNAQACTGGPQYNLTDPLTGEGTTQPLAPCTTPLAQPTNLSLSAANTSVAGTFNPSATADAYVVVRSTSPALSALPADGSEYTVGTTLGGGTVVSNTTATSFTASGLTSSTTYYFFVFAQNKNCLGGTKYRTATPLTGSVTTTATPPYQVYFGNLHAHSDYSDGNKDHPGYTPADDYNYALTAECMDFLGISEHNHFSSLDNPGNLLTNYRKGAVQAGAFNAQHPNFLALYGMEWGVISGGGHVVIYGDGMDKLFGWESNVGGQSGPNYDVFVAKSDYTGPSGLFKTVNDHAAYNTFATLAHPNSTDYNNLSNVAYDAVADGAIVGTAVESGPANSTNTSYSNPGSSLSHLWYYQKMLSRGYRLGPVIDHDNHNTTFGKTTRSRTAVIAPALTQTEIVKAMRDMRFYATQDCDLRVDFTVNTRVMGSAFSDRNAPSIAVRLTDPTTATASAKIRILFGVPGSGILPVALDSAIGGSLDLVDNKLPVNTTGYYYAEITSGTAMAVTSPIWYTRVCSFATDTFAKACQRFDWYGTEYTSSTTATRHFTTAAGCDSVVTLHLTVYAPNGSDTTARACESFTWYGATYTASGDYTHVLTNEGGCDSTLTLHLTVDPKPDATITASGATTFCPGGEVTLSAPAATTYRWSNDATTSSITVSESGAYTVTVTDANGCKATSAAVTVTAADNTPPTVITRNIEIALDENGQATITAAQVDNGSTDGCGIAATGYSLDRTSFTCADIGANTVTLTVTDKAGNAASATAIVTVKDDRAPVVSTRNLTVQLTAAGTASITPAQVNDNSTDNCAIPSTGYALDKTTFTCADLGANTVTLTVTDASGNSATATATVTVQDVSAPIPDMAQLPELKGECNVTVATRPTASDACAGPLTATTTDPLSYTIQGTYTVTWTYNDGHGNTATQMQKVTVKDETKPVITACPSLPVLCYNATGVYTIPQLTATDNCGTTIVSFRITGVTSRTGNGTDASGAFNVGVSTITWTVSDGHGNQATCTTTVTVNKPITATVADVFAVSPGGAANTLYVSYGPSSLTLTATVSGGTPPYTYKWTAGSPAGAGLGNAATFTASPSATTTYYLNVKDAYGCAVTYVTKTVYVVDVRCGAKLDKVTVCVPQKSGASTTCVTAGQVTGYLSSGGYLGACVPAATITRAGGAPLEVEDVAPTGLCVTAAPNPSHGPFTLRVKSNDKVTPVRLSIVDAAGKVLETRQTAAGQTVELASRFRPGVYVCLVQQGNQWATVKLVRLQE